MTTNISRETGRLSLLLRSPAKFEPYALRLPSPSSLFSILNEDFIQVSYSDLLSASWQRDAWQYVKSLRRRAYLREKNKKEKEMEFLSSFSSSLLSRGIYFSSLLSSSLSKQVRFTILFSEANVSMPNSQRESKVVKRAGIP